MDFASAQHPQLLSKMDKSRLIIKHTAQENLSSDNKRSFDEEVLGWISENCPDWNNADIKKTYMIPPTFPDIPKQDNKGDLTEKHVFDMLKEFGDKTKQPMFVVHSHRFSELFQKFENGIVKNLDSHWLRGEADFVIIHKKLGVIFLQVKAAVKTAGAYVKAKAQIDKDQTALTCSLKRLSISELDRKLSKEEENTSKQLGLKEPERKTENKITKNREQKCNELGTRVQKEMNMYPGFVVMPNCSRDKAGDRTGCFKEDIQSVEDFAGWWKKNILRDLQFSEDMYKLMAIRYVGLRVLNESCILKDVIDKTHKRLIMLTESQLSIMTQDVPKQDIVGPAGSGKTWLLLEKVNQVAVELKGNERILIMCFNKPLSLYLATEFRNISKEKVVIKTFVAMLMKILDREIDLDSLSAKEKAVTECVQKLKSMQANSDPTFSYEHVFVDEAQDMFGEWTDLTELLKLLHVDSDKERRYRWVFFDSNQSVHFGAQKKVPDMIINKAKLMTEIVRNTSNIFNCSRMYLSPPVCAKLGHGIVGLQVKWIDRMPNSTNPSLYLSWEQLRKGAKLLIEEIAVLHRESVETSDIVVLTNNKYERDKVCSIFRSKNIQTQNAEEAIPSPDNAIPSPDNAIPSPDNGITSPDNAITVDSIRRFKGLERKVVILLAPPIDDETKMGVNYVAMSRCFCLLVIVTSQEKKQKYEKLKLQLRCF